MDFQSILFVTYRNFFQESESLISFLERKRVIKPVQDCPGCGEPMTISADKLSLSCSRFGSPPSPDGTEVNEQCNRTISRVSKKLLGDPPMTLLTICTIINHCLYMDPPYLVFEKIPGVTPDQKTEWLHHIREICYSWVSANSEKLGGNGFVVEIDEMLVVKPGGRGQANRVTWVFGGFERGSSKVFMAPAGGPGKDELFRIINTWVLPNTTVAADCWSDHHRLDEAAPPGEQLHRSVNFVPGGNPHYHKTIGRTDREWKQQEVCLTQPWVDSILHNTDLSVFLFKRTTQCDERADIFFRLLGERF